MAEREGGDDEDRADESAARIEEAVQQTEREEGEMHAPELRVHPPPAPHERVVLHAEATVARDERRSGTRDDRAGGRHAKTPERPPHRDRQRDHQQPAHQVEDREQIDERQDAMDRYDREMRQVLVIDERWEAE